MGNEFQYFSDFSPSLFSGRYAQLNEFLCRRQLPLLAAGDEQRSKLTSIEEVEAYSKKMRAVFIEKLGGVPERDCPLEPQITKTADYGNYIIESIILQSRKGCYVTGSMYIPKGLNQPSAAVLFLCGHSLQGRMAPAYLKVCQILVQAGLIVFAIDPTGQGERLNFCDPATGEFYIKDPTREHDLCGVPSIATGRFLESYFLSDQYAAVEYMISRPEIDPARIGVTGCSGGGTQSLAMMACDDRIAAAVPVCFTSNRREILYSNQAQDSEQIWPGCAEYGFDHYEPYILFAPKPAMILTATSDFFPIEGAYDVYDCLKDIYALYGKEENISIREVNKCHGYSPEQGELAADFFCHVFGVKRALVVDTASPVPCDQTATECGNVFGHSADAIAIPEENRIRAVTLRQNRKLSQARQWLMERVEYARLPVDPRPRICDEKTQRCINGYTAKAAMWWVQKQLSAFGVFIYKGENDYIPNCPIVVALWDDGTLNIPGKEEWIKAQCDAGKQVLVVDLPGSGAIKQAKLWGWADYYAGYGTMYKMCCDLLYMNDSMAAMQTYHILRTVAMIKECLHIDDVSIYCEEQDGVYGVMAGYLADIPRIYGENLLNSVEEKIVKPVPMKYSNTLSYLIPGMLEYFDYYELIE